MPPRKQSAEGKVRGKGREEVSGGEHEEKETVGWTTEWRGQ